MIKEVLEEGREGNGVGEVEGGIEVELEVHWAQLEALRTRVKASFRDLCDPWCWRKLVGKGQRGRNEGG